MEKIYKRPNGIKKDAVAGYCPGCMHSTIHKLMAEVLDDLGVLDKAVFLVGVGCCGLGNMYMDMDNVNCAHGRACAVATGLKRSNPESVVFTYQGDGDLAAIGLAETISAANRGENFTVIFVNNSTYGMTGGQMAPTTLVGQKATTAPYGRKVEEHGYPIHMSEILSQLPAVAYVERTTCTTAANVLKTKKAMKKAFKNQIDGKGFSIVEIMSNCPTNWGMSPLDSLKYMNEQTLVEFPLGVFKDIDAQ